jgi:cytochrome c-type biogenesis protein CcmF
MNFLVERFGANGYIGEHLWLGHLGHLLIVLSFVGSLLAFIAYFAQELSGKHNEPSGWRKIARSAFYVHGFSIIGVFVLLFIMILNHWFEYHYAWRHSSLDLPLKYIISSFWEGQEGSFLLWIFWIVLLGFVGIRTLKNYESGVMSVISITQFFLSSMVLGVYVFGFKLGSSPFILLRVQNDLREMAPVVFSNPENLLNYLSFIKDGQGLNILLQNYWMTIHPPVLFLGFASVSFPFAFALTSLLRRDWDGWLKPALPWTLFSVGILGTGILMGGAWAYEALSFGGFWAWDPVENMSFVPWLMVVAGLHTLLVYRHTKHSLTSTYVFFLLGFITVLYSTYLTRSGRLGDTSVHSFTDDGLEPQLLAYFFFFIVSSFTLLAIRAFKKQLPRQEKEEELWSREFWMFIGTLVLLLSSVQMIFTTSIPVWNLLFHDTWKLMTDKLAPPEDAVQHYNSIQIWLGILIAGLTGLVQYLSYKSGLIPSTAKWAIYTFLVSLLASFCVAYVLDISFTQQYVIDLSRISESLFLRFPFVSAYFLFLIAALYATFGNLGYLIFVLKGNWKLSGGAVSHFGLGIFLVGVLISQGKKEVISTNGVNAKDFDPKERAENILLLRDSTDKMGEYFVTYFGQDSGNNSTFYKVKYELKDKEGKVNDEFVLAPEAGVMKGGSLNSNPDTKHYWSKDVFTHVSSVPDNSKLKDSVSIVEAAVGDTLYTSNSYLIVNSFTARPDMPADFDKDGKLMVGVNIAAKTTDGKSYDIQPVFIIDTRNDNELSSKQSEVTELGLKVEINKINPETQKVSLQLTETERPIDFIIMKAIIFPFINLVWLGGIVTFLGAFISAWRRRKD